MKKTISLLLLTALCLCMLTSCDMGNGLVAELFKNIGYEDEVLYEPPVEYGTEPYYDIPELVQMGFLSLGVQYADGSVKELMDAKELLEWNGELEVEYAPDAYLYVKGFAAYNSWASVEYKCDVAGSKSERFGDFYLSEYAGLYGPIECDEIHGFYYLIPLDALTFENDVALYAEAPSANIDGWIMYTSMHILMVPGELTEMYTEMESEIDCEGTLPPDCMEEPTEEMTDSPATDETAAQDH